MTDAPPSAFPALSAEDVAALPIRRYEGEIHLPTSAAELERAMTELRRDTVLGFDTETRPTFRKGEHYPPSLVQIAGSRAVHLFPIQRLDCTAALAELIDHAGIIKVGVALAHDLRELNRVMPIEPAGIVDLGRVARRHGIRQTGLRNLAARFLGLRIPKGQRTTNWASPRLTPAQLRYAATDAWIARELYRRFESAGWLTPADVTAHKKFMEKDAGYP